MKLPEGCVEVGRNRAAIAWKGPDGSFFRCGIDTPHDWYVHHWDEASVAAGLESAEKFWQEKISLNGVRIEGNHYTVGDENAKGMRGFGGVKFRIKFNDGTVVTTTNLWHQGKIPTPLQNELPNNAIFVDEYDETP